MIGGKTGIAGVATVDCCGESWEERRVGERRDYRFEWIYRGY